MVCWINLQKRFSPNWEVEKVVYIPLQDLLNPSFYARYRLNIETSKDNENHPDIRDYPCFIQQSENGTEILWGATFRITMVFLEIVFGFKPPDIKSLPVLSGSLDKNYLTGNG